MIFYSNKPSVPKTEDYQRLVESIFDSGFLTNFGQYHNALLEKLKRKLDTKNIALCNNATTALACVIRSISDPKKSDIITTPFTFSATCHSIIWANKKPVFVDVEDNGFNLCPKAVENAIDKNTAAIVPVHCYGIPCNLDKFDDISVRYNIPIIYDAAHAFGVKYGDKSLVANGSASVVSTHATKAFNTAEGALVYFREDEKCSQFASMTNFGIDENGETSTLGLNGKLSELHAALGVANLETFEKNIEKRQKLWNHYSTAFRSDDRIQLIELDSNLRFNFGYCPLTILDDTIRVDRVIAKLAESKIIARKYFSPILNNTSTFKESKVAGNLKNAKHLNNRVLCLPIHESYLPHAEFLISEIKRALFK